MATLKELDELEKRLRAEAEAARRRRVAAEQKVDELTTEQQRLEAEASRLQAQADQHAAAAKAALVRLRKG